MTRRTAPVWKSSCSRGKENGVEGLEILEKKELLALEPALSEEVVCALHAPTGGIVCPFKLTIALAENAAVNGVEFHLNEARRRELSKGPVEGYFVETEKGTYETRIVVNAAGLYSDEIHNQVSGEKLHITPRKGEYCLMDKKIGQLVSHTIFQMPTAMGKGVLVTPTVHGNLMVGPTATDISDKEGRGHHGRRPRRSAEKGGSQREEPAAGRDDHLLCGTSGS